MNLRSTKDQEHSFEEVAVADGLAFFEQEVGSPPDEEVLVPVESFVEGAEVSLAYSFDDRYEFGEGVFLEDWGRIRAIVGR